MAWTGCALIQQLQRLAQHSPAVLRKPGLLGQTIQTLQLPVNRGTTLGRVQSRYVSQAKSNGTGGRARFLPPVATGFQTLSDQPSFSIVEWDLNGECVLPPRSWQIRIPRLNCMHHGLFCSSCMLCMLSLQLDLSLPSILERCTHPSRDLGHAGDIKSGLALKANRTDPRCCLLETHPTYCATLPMTHRNAAHAPSSGSKANGSKASGSQRSLKALWKHETSTPGVSVTAHSTPQTGSSTQTRVTGTKRPPQTPLASAPGKQRRDGSSSAWKQRTDAVDLSDEPVSPKLDQPRQAAPEHHARSLDRRRTDAQRQVPQQHTASGDDAQRKRAFQRLLGDGTSKDAQARTFGQGTSIMTNLQQGQGTRSPVAQQDRSCPMRDTAVVQCKQQLH